LLKVPRNAEEWWNVLAVPAGEDVNCDDVQPVAQVLLNDPAGSSSRFRFVAAMILTSTCSGGAADTLKRLLLKDAQEFHLHPRRNVAHFIQE
jgi:hypothetical protein